MSLRSWLSFGQTEESHEGRQKVGIDSKQVQQTSSASESTEGNVSFEDIASRFTDLTTEVDRLQQLAISQAVQIADQNRVYTKQLEDLKQDFSAECNVTLALQQAIASGRQLSQLRKQGPADPFVQYLKSQRKKQRDESNKDREAKRRAEQSTESLRKELAYWKTEHAKLNKEYLGAKNECADLKFELEYTKCITAGVHGSHCETKVVDPNVPLPDVPFVAVLVDGDAYRFAAVGPNRSDAEPEIHPARRVSANIKNYLHAYLLEHGLPAHCKLFVRILQNGSSVKGYHRVNPVKRKARTVSVTEDFMLEFTESSPLFDYIDAGTGKERVDGKIHELYHLFIPNRSCHKIFIAAATDNGFARMFEQYIDHPTARAKTCLISSGLIAEEIKHLNLETVEWPAVFSMRIAPNAAGQQKEAAARRRQREEKEKRQKEMLIETLGVSGYEQHIRDLAIAQVTRELNGWRDVPAMIQDLLESRTCSIRSQSRLSRSQTDQHSMLSSCLEDGVD